MDADIKKEFDTLNGKFDTYIAHQEKVCELHRKPFDEHVKDGPHFRDKMVKLCSEVNINRVLILLMVAGCIGGFWWMLRS